MANAAFTVQGINELRAWPDSPTPFPRWFEVALKVAGSYQQSTNQPAFNFLSALQASHFGAKTVNVISVQVARDYYDGTNRYSSVDPTGAATGFTLSTVNAGCTNDQIRVQMTSGNTDGGSGGAELAANTVVSGFITLLVKAEIVAE